MNTPAVMWETTRRSALSEIAWSSVSAHSGKLSSAASASSLDAQATAKQREARWAHDDSQFRRDRNHVQLDIREMRRRAIKKTTADR